MTISFPAGLLVAVYTAPTASDAVAGDVPVNARATVKMSAEPILLCRMFLLLLKIEVAFEGYYETEAQEVTG
jgi:hypothetical protein